MAHNLWAGLFDNTHTQRGPAAVDASTAATADGDRNGVGAGDGDGVELQTVVAGQSYFNKSSSFAAALLSASAKDIKQGQGEG